MRRYAVVFTPCAERQRAEPYARIADASGEPSAEKFVGGIVANRLPLETFPEQGKKRDDIRPNLRVKGLARRASIAYSVNISSLTVAIHGVFYGGQDFERVLRETDADN